MNSIEFLDKNIKDLYDLRKILLRKTPYLLSYNEAYSHAIALMLKEKHEKEHYFYEFYQEHGVDELTKSFFEKGNNIAIYKNEHRIVVETKENPINLLFKKKSNKEEINEVTVYHFGELIK